MSNDVYIDTGLSPVTDVKLYTSAAQGPQSFTATITETTTAVSDTVLRSLAAARTLTEVTNLTESVTRLLVALRTLTEALPAPSDTVTAATGIKVGGPTATLTFTAPAGRLPGPLGASPWHTGAMHHRWSVGPLVHQPAEIPMLVRS